MANEYQVMSPRAQWVDKDGLPTQAFYRCILGLFEIIGANSPGNLLPDNSVANAKLVQAPAQSLKGNPTAVLANVADVPIGTGLHFDSGALATDSASFTSLPQAIATSGQLVLIHDLGSIPLGVSIKLRCLVGEAAVVAGQEVEVGLVSVNVITDSTKLTVRYNNSANVFTIPNATTGAPTALTNANWQAIFKAWI